MSETVTKIVRKLRKEQTDSEKILWNFLRNRKLDGVKFYRQFPIKFIFEKKQRFYVADFYTNKNNLIIEVDGSIHEELKDKDRFRDYICDKLGYRVLRIQNDEINKNIDKVLEKIKFKIK